jgi:hypothetical protein
MIILSAVLIGWLVIAVAALTLSRMAGKAGRALTDDERREESELLALERAWRRPATWRARSHPSGLSAEHRRRPG